jgi:hypothetical protein
MKPDENKVYMKIVELDINFCLNTSLDQNHWNNVQIYIKLIDFIIFMWGS